MTDKTGLIVICVLGMAIGALGVGLALFGLVWSIVSWIKGNTIAPFEEFPRCTCAEHKSGDGGMR